MNKIYGWILCKFGKHDREHWSQERCEKERVFWGIFAPYKCRRCGYKSQIFHIPPMPKELER